jgi:hypothetical protein
VFVTAAADHTSAYFALAGALGAAVLAIGGSQLGLWRERKAQAARLDRTLEEERERLRLRLDHDRRIRDLDEARRLLAPAAEVAYATYEPVTLLARSVAAMAERPDRETKERVDERRRDAQAFVDSLTPHYFSLTVLFGPDAEVTESFSETLKVTSALVTLAAASDSFSAADARRARELDKQHTRALAGFGVAAFEAVGWTDDELSAADGDQPSSTL